MASKISDLLKGLIDPKNHNKGDEKTAAQENNKLLEAAGIYGKEKKAVLDLINNHADLINAMIENNAVIDKLTETYDELTQQGKEDLELKEKLIVLENKANKLANDYIDRIEDVTETYKLSAKSSENVGNAAASLANKLGNSEKGLKTSGSSMNWFMEQGIAGVKKFTGVFGALDVAIGLAFTQIMENNDKLINFARDTGNTIDPGFNKTGGSLTGSLSTVAIQANVEQDSILNSLKGLNKGQVAGAGEDMNRAGVELQKFGVQAAKLQKFWGVDSNTVQALSSNLTYKYGQDVKSLNKEFEAGKKQAVAAGVSVGDFFSKFNEVSNLAGSLYISNGVKGMRNMALVSSKLQLSIGTMAQTAGQFANYTDMYSKQNTATQLGMQSTAANTAKIWAQFKLGNQPKAQMMLASSMAQDMKRLNYVDKEGNIDNRGLDTMKAAGYSAEQIVVTQNLIRQQKKLGLSFEQLTDIDKQSLSVKHKILAYEKENQTIGEKMKNIWGKITSLILDPLASVLGPLANIVLDSLESVIDGLLFVFKPMIWLFGLVGAGLTKINHGINWLITGFQTMFGGIIDWVGEIKATFPFISKVADVFGTLFKAIFGIIGALVLFKTVTYAASLVGGKSKILSSALNLLPGKGKTSVLKGMANVKNLGVTGLLTTSTTFIKNLPGMVKNLASSGFKLIPGLFAGVFAMTKNLFSFIINSLGTIIKTLFTGLNGMFSNLKSFFSKIGTGMISTAKTLFSAVGGGLSSIVKNIASFGGTILSSTKNFLSKVLSDQFLLGNKLFAKIGNVLSSTLSGFTKLGNSILSTGKNVFSMIGSKFSTIGSSLSKTASELLSKGKIIASTGGSKIVSGAKTLITKGGNLFSGAKELITKGGSNLFSGVKTLITKSGSNLFSGVKTLITTGGTNLFSGAKTLITKGSNVFSGVKNIITKSGSNLFSGVKTLITTGGANLFSGAKSLITKGSSSLFTGAKNIGTKIGQTFTGVKNLVTKKPGTIIGGAKNVFSNMKNGISSGFKSLFTKTPGKGGLLKTAGKGLGKLGSVGKGLLKGGGLAAIAGFGGEMLGNAVGGKAGNTISKVSSAAATGAMIGSIFPGIGTAVGAGVGALVGLVQASQEEIGDIWHDNSKSTWEKLSGTMGVLLENLKGMFSGAWDWIKGIFKKDVKDEASIKIAQDKINNPLNDVNKIMANRVISNSHAAQQAQETKMVNTFNPHIKIISSFDGAIKTRIR